MTIATRHPEARLDLTSFCQMLTGEVVQKPCDRRASADLVSPTLKTSPRCSLHARAIENALEEDPGAYPGWTIEWNDR